MQNKGKKPSFTFFLRSMIAPVARLFTTKKRPGTAPVNKQDSEFNTQTGERRTPFVLHPLYGKQKRKQQKQISYYLPSFIYSFLGFSLLIIAVGVVVFFSIFRGPEEILIPDVESMKITNALIALQERGLHANLRLRYFSDPLMKDRVVSQHPIAGSVAKVGKIVVLTVSRGAVVETVRNYVGSTLADLRRELQTLYAGQSKPLLVVGNISYVFAEEDTGTILEQEPLPATPIVEETKLNLVISKGRNPAAEVVENYVGMDYRDAIISLSTQGVPFSFQLAKAQETDSTIEIEGAAETETVETALAADSVEQENGIILNQFPAAGMFLDPGSVVTLSLLPPATSGDEIFSLVRFDIPNHSVLADISVVVLEMTGERNTIFTGNHPGGMFVFPYMGKGTVTLILYRYDVEIDRVLIQAQSSEGNDR